MATAEVQIAPSNTVAPGSILLPTAPLPFSDDGSIPSPESIASDWVSTLNDALGKTRFNSNECFVKESYWRDLLCMTWDFRTLQGPQKIQSFVESSPKANRIINVSLDQSVSHKVPQVSAFADLKFIQASLKVETNHGRGEGVVRLVTDIGDDRRWKAFTLFTILKELKGHEERVGNRRPTGLEGDRENGDQNWKDRRIAQGNFEGGREPAVLILGRLLEQCHYRPNPLMGLRFRRCWSGRPLHCCSTETAWP